MGKQKKKKQSAYKIFVQKFEETKEETIEKLNKEYARIEIEKIEISENQFCLTLTLDGKEDYIQHGNVNRSVQMKQNAYGLLKNCLSSYIQSYNNRTICNFKKALFSDVFLARFEHALQDAFHTNSIHVKPTSIQMDFGGHTVSLNLFDFCKMESYFTCTYDANKIVQEIRWNEMQEKVQEQMIADTIHKLEAQVFSIDDKVLREETTKYYDVYNNKYTRLLTGLPKIKKYAIKLYVTLNEPNIIHIHSKEIEWIVSKDGMKIVQVSENMGRFLEIQKTDDFQECKALLIELDRNSQMKLQSSQGILNGSLDIFMFEAESNQTFKAHVKTARELFDSRETWLETIENVIEEVEDKWRDAKKKAEEEKYAAFLELQETFLVRDIIEFVKLNPNGYITINKLTNYLKGRKVQSSSELKEIKHFIPYKNYTDEEIDYEVRKLVYNYGLLRYQHCSNRYTDYYILLINRSKECKIVLQERKLTADKILSKLYDADYTPTDAESKCIFNSIKNKGIIELTDCNVLLRLIHAKGFICRYKDEYISTLKKAPNAFKTLLKLKIENEEDIFVKKLYKEILKK